MLRGEKRRRTLPHDGESDSALLVAAVGVMPHLRAPHHRVAVPALQQGRGHAGMERRKGRGSKDAPLSTRSARRTAIFVQFSYYFLFAFLAFLVQKV
jgi:hypothetical protein